MKSTIGFFGTLVLMYLAGAFVNADFDTASWGIAGRGFVAFTAIFLATAIASALWNE